MLGLTALAPRTIRIRGPHHVPGTPSLPPIPAVLLLAACAAPVDHAGQVRQADVDFASETAARGNDGWADYFMPDGILFQTNGRVEGRDAIRIAMADAFGPDARLDWEPVTAVAAQSGDLAYTVGRWATSMVRPDGTDSVTGRGDYVTIWRRDAEGRWRVAIDIGNTDGEPAPP